MFTEGLDNNALKWVREGSGQQTKEVPYSISSQRSRIDPIGSMRNGSRNVGLPPPSKFRSGHMSGVIPLSRVILDSSPHDDRVPSTTAATQRYYNLPPSRAVQYASDSMFSDDVSSSMETLGRGHGYVADRLMRGANRYPNGSSVYTEEESSDSAASSEFSSTQVGTNNGTVPRSTNYASEGYASSIPSSKAQMIGYFPILKIPSNPCVPMRVFNHVLIFVMYALIFSFWSDLV